MSLWAIVPVKPLRRGKSRLAGVLSEEERTVLNFTMLEHTLKTIGAVAEIEQTLVISRDPSALSLARDYGARTLLEEGAPKLNTAVRRATIVAKAYAVEGLLILPADLPTLTPSDIQAVLQLGQNPPVVVVAPDRHERGTNALLINPAGIIDYEFGVGSFQKHCDRALAVGVRLEICRTPGLGLDLDLPEDLELLRQMEVPLLKV